MVVTRGFDSARLFFSFFFFFLSFEVTIRSELDYHRINQSKSKSQQKNFSRADQHATALLCRKADAQTGRAPRVHHGVVGAEVEEEGEFALLADFPPSDGD